MQQFLEHKLLFECSLAPFLFFLALKPSCDWLMEYSSVKRGSIDFIDVGFRSSFEIKLQMTHKYESHNITHYRAKIYRKDHNDF